MNSRATPSLLSTGKEETLPSSLLSTLPSSLLSTREARKEETSLLLAFGLSNERSVSSLSKLNKVVHRPLARRVEREGGKGRRKGKEEREGGNFVSSFPLFVSSFPLFVSHLDA
jgi:hypothetical protein